MIDLSQLRFYFFNAIALYVQNSAVEIALKLYWEISICWCLFYWGLQFGFLVFACWSKTNVYLDSRCEIFWTRVFAHMICVVLEKNQWLLWLVWSLLCSLSWSWICINLWGGVGIIGLCFGMAMNRELNCCVAGVPFVLLKFAFSEST
jgi:hypothetical protein